MAARAQFFGRRSIEGKPLGLKEWSLVPLHAEPAHAIEDALHHILGRSLEIGILDAQNEGATGVPGKEPVEEGSARAAYMQIAGRRGRETNARRLGVSGIAFPMLFHFKGRRIVHRLCETIVRLQSGRKAIRERRL